METSHEVSPSDGLKCLQFSAAAARGSFHGRLELNELRLENWDSFGGSFRHYCNAYFSFSNSVGVVAANACDTNVGIFPSAFDHAC